MAEFFANQQWLIIAIIFFGIIGYIAWVRWQDRKWIDKRFGSHKVLAISFGVNFFGCASEPGKPRKSSGFLLLLSDRLFYRSRLKKIELQKQRAEYAIKRAKEIRGLFENMFGG